MNKEYKVAICLKSYTCRPLVVKEGWPVWGGGVQSPKQNFYLFLFNQRLN
jgi:hypothetical protein